jgi:hypothetical protein
LAAIPAVISVLTDSRLTVREAALKAITRLATMGMSVPYPPSHYVQGNSQLTLMPAWISWFLGLVGKIGWLDASPES